MKPNNKQNLEKNSNDNVLETKTTESTINSIDQTSTNSSKLNKKSLKKIIILAIILVLILVGGISYLIYHFQRKTNSTSVAATTQLAPYNGVAVFDNNKGTLSLINSSDTNLKSVSLGSNFNYSKIKYYNSLFSSTALLLNSYPTGSWILLNPNGSYQRLSSSVANILNSYSQIDGNAGLDSTLVDGQNIFLAKGYYLAKPYTYNSVNLISGQSKPIISVTPLQKLSVFQPYNITSNGRDVVALIDEALIGSTKVSSIPAIALINIKTGKLDKITNFPPVVAASNGDLCNVQDGCNGTPVGLSLDGNLIAFCDDQIVKTNGSSFSTCNPTVYNLTTQKVIKLALPAGFSPNPNGLDYQNGDNHWVFSPNGQYIAISGSIPSKNSTQGVGTDSEMYIFSVANGKMIKSFDVGSGNYKMINIIGWLTDNNLVYGVSTANQEGQFITQPTYYTINLKNHQISAYPSSLGYIMGILSTTN